MSTLIGVMKPILTRADYRALVDTEVDQQSSLKQPDLLAPM